MTEEFKKQFDAFSNIEKAIGLAYDLGYDEAFLDGARITSPTYIQEMKNEITSLCGGKWTEEVLTAYDVGDYDGCMDT